MNKFSQIFDFLRFVLKSTNQHGIHSPYLFDFYNNIIEDDRTFYDFEKIDAIRRSYAANHIELEIIELGAGSSYGNNSKKKISEIASQQLSSAYQLRIIYRMIDWLSPKTCIELGTSLGLSTLTMALASPQSKVIAFEGNPNFVRFLEEQQRILEIQNIETIEGNFDKTFRDYCENTNSIDFAFIDGNHREEATIRYFNWASDASTENAVLVFDDIHWSKGMNNAWNTIINDSRVNASIDLYFMGIVFLSTDFKEKRHLRIRPTKYFF